MATFTGHMDTDNLNHYFPLQPDGRFVSLSVPRDLTTGEAKRLCGFIESLAFDSEANQ